MARRGTKDRINDKSAPLNKILEKLKQYNFTLVVCSTVTMRKLLKSMQALTR